jgi:hypothetical protein
MSWVHLSMAIDCSQTAGLSVALLLCSTGDVVPYQATKRHELRARDGQIILDLNSRYKDTQSRHQTTVMSDLYDSATRLLNVPLLKSSRRVGVTDSSADAGLCVNGCRVRTDDKR